MQLKIKKKKLDISSDYSTIQTKSNPELLYHDNKLKKNLKTQYPFLSKKIKKHSTSIDIYSSLISLKKNISNKYLFKTAENHSKNEKSLLMKKLENWDKEHLSMSKENPDSLYQRLSKLYKTINLKKEQQKLEQMNFLLKSKTNFNKLMEKGNRSNKILDDFFNKRNKDQGSILRNNIVKTKARFNFSLFLPKNQKDIEQDIGVNTQTINAMVSGDFNNDYYNKVMKDKIKYENQLRDELISVNNDIYDKKNEKKEKDAELSAVYFKQNKLTKDYNVLFNRRKSMLEKYKDDLDKQYCPIKIKKKNLNIKTTSKINNFLKNARVSIKNNEIKKSMTEEKQKYADDMEKIQKEKEKIIKDIKRIEEEMLYYKQVNDELIKEHRQYYMDILKNGYDSRGEGMIWCVRNLLELQTNLEYHHFPKFLTHEEIDYLIKIANISLEEIQLKIILKTLKKKQSELKDKENVRRLSDIDELINKINNRHEKKNHMKYLSDYDLQRKKVKMEIDKRFYNLYTRNEETMKMFVDKKIEENKDEALIEGLKEDLLGRNNEKKHESELFRILKGDDKQKNIAGLILYIRDRLDYLYNHKEEIIEEQINKFKERQEMNEMDLDVKQLMQKELVKKCLFGSDSNF